MTEFVPTELRRCGECRKDYVTAILTEERGEGQTVWEEPCPYCRAAPTRVVRQREMGAARAH
jgi:hypothetical protein